MFPKRRRRLAVGLSLGIVVATVLVLTLVPIPQTFSMHNAVIPDLYSCTGLRPTQGTTVNFHWSTAGFTDFYVVSCSVNEAVYQANGTQGTGSFVSDGGMYDFGSGCPGPGSCYPAEVTGSYTGPLLTL